MVIDKSKSITWIFTGDSITQGTKHTNGQRNYVEHIAELIRGDLQRYTDVVINTGISNDTTNILLKTWKDRVVKFMPDVVSVMMGMNDCYNGIIETVIPAMKDCNKFIDLKEFSNNLIEIIRRIREIGAIPVLHKMSTIDLKADSHRQDLWKYVEVIRSVSHKAEVILVDNYEFWKTAPKASQWLNDSCHPNEYGHQAIADRFFCTLNILPETYSGYLNNKSK